MKWSLRILLAAMDGRAGRDGCGKEACCWQPVLPEFQPNCRTTSWPTAVLHRSDTQSELFTNAMETPSLVSVVISSGRYPHELQSCAFILFFLLKILMSYHQLGRF